MNLNSFLNFSMTYESKVTAVVTSAVILPLLLFTVLSLKSTSDAVTKTIANGLEAKSVLVAHDINSFIGERIIDAKILSQADVLESKDVPKTIQYLTEIVAANRWINDIDVLDISGYVRASSGIQNENGQFVADLYPGSGKLHKLLKTSKQGDVFVSEVLSLDTGYGLLIMTPITDDTNTVIIGALALEVNLDNISRIVTLFDEGIIGKKYVYIVDNDGRVLITADPTINVFDPYPDLSVQPALLAAFANQGDVGNVIYHDHTGEEVIAGYADMDEFGVNQALDWSIIAVAPLDEIAVEASKVKTLLVILGLIIGAITMLLVFFYMSKLQSSLKSIATVADSISQGDYSQRIGQSGQPGALELLFNAFNNMAVKVEGSIDKLEHHADELEILNKKLKNLSEIDPLTKIANRRSYENRLAHEIASAKRNEKTLTQLMIDVDYFKAYNDHYGHDSGDVTLRRIAESIDNSLLRETDFCARFGGEEFVVLLPNTNEANAYSIAERIRLDIKALGINHKDSEITSIVTVSIGIASLSDESLNENDLLRNADAALYEAKRSGRNCCGIFTS